MSAAPLTPGALRHIAEQVIKHRRRLRATFTLYGATAANLEVSTFVQVGSRPKFLLDAADAAEFYAITRALGRELDRLLAADRADRNAARLAKGYVSPALAAAAT